jgi:DNA polymerase III psi subunit
VSLPRHDLPWSSEQREWLQVLGHDVLMLAGATAMPELPREASSAAAQPTTAARTTVAASPLLRALARAAGRNEQDAELLQALPDFATLRGNPAARRALWPRLRALRKRRSQ